MPAPPPPAGARTRGGASGDQLTGLACLVCAPQRSDPDRRHALDMARAAPLRRSRTARCRWAPRRSHWT